MSNGRSFQSIAAECLKQRDDETVRMCVTSVTCDDVVSKVTFEVCRNTGCESVSAVEMRWHAAASEAGEEVEWCQRDDLLPVSHEKELCCSVLRQSVDGRHSSTVYSSRADCWLGYTLTRRQSHELRQKMTNMPDSSGVVVAGVQQDLATAVVWLSNVGRWSRMTPSDFSVAATGGVAPATSTAANHLWLVALSAFRRKLLVTHRHRREQVVCNKARIECDECRR